MGEGDTNVRDQIRYNPEFKQLVFNDQLIGEDKHAFEILQERP